MESVVLILLSSFVVVGILWTAWDLHIDRRRRRRQ